MPRLTILGGGGFRVPLVYGALLADHGEPRIDEVVLHDVDQARLDAVVHVLAQQAAGVPDARRSGLDGNQGAAPAVPAEHACAVAAWTGPQTRARIETVLCDARISRVLLDDVGQVKELEALRDSVTAAQRRPWPPATEDAPPAAAQDHPPCATPTTCAPAPTAATPPWTTSRC